MAVTPFKLPTSVIQNGTGVNAWLNPDNILLVDGEFASTSDTTAELVVGTFNLNVPVDATINNFTVRIKGYRGSFDTTLQIYAVDATTGVTQSYPLAPFQGFDGTNTLYTLSSSLFSTTWDYNQANNIQLKLMVDGELHMDSVEMNCSYTPAIVPVPPTPPTGQVVVDEFVQGIRFQLAQSMTASDLFLFAESLTLPDGTLIQYADFYGEALITVDQGVYGLEENIRITNIEHDYDGTGLVKISFDTIDNRGLGFIYPYLGSVTRAHPHDGTAEFVISNSAPFYNRFLRRNQIGALVSAPISIYDESTLLTTAMTTLVFEGAGVTATVDGTDLQKIHITIPGGGGSALVIEDNGSALATEPALNFVDYFTVTNSAGVRNNVSINVTELANDTTFINALTSNGTFQTNVNSFVTGGAGGAYFVDQSPDNGTYGAITGAVNGSNTLFTVSQGEYVSGKLIVYLNGLAQLQGASDDWQQTTPASGTFTFNTAPVSGDIITVLYLTSASVIDNYTVKATVADTTPSYLDSKFEIVSSDSSVTIVKTIQNPGANEIISYDLSATGAPSVVTVNAFDDFVSIGETQVHDAPSRYLYRAGNFVFSRVGQIVASESNHPGIIRCTQTSDYLNGFTSNGDGYSDGLLELANGFNVEILTRLEYAAVNSGTALYSMSASSGVDLSIAIGTGTFTVTLNAGGGSLVITPPAKPASLAWFKIIFEYVGGVLTVTMNNSVIYTGSVAVSGIGSIHMGLPVDTGLNISYDYVKTNYSATR